MSAIIKHFQTLTQIPHCSKKADKLLEFLVDFAKERDYKKYFYIKRFAYTLPSGPL